MHVHTLDGPPLLSQGGAYLGAGRTCYDIMQPARWAVGLLLLLRLLLLRGECQLGGDIAVAVPDEEETHLYDELHGGWGREVTRSVQGE